MLPVEPATVMMAALGSAGTFLIIMKRGRCWSSVMGFTIGSFGLGLGFAKNVGDKYSMAEWAAAFAIAFACGFVLPSLQTYVPNFVRRKLTEKLSGGKVEE